MGVPQGSVLGPVLFLLYINNITDLNDEAHFVLYADDTSLLVSEKSCINLKHSCELVISNLINWFNNLSLYFNSDKTQLVRFHTAQKHIDSIILNVNDSTEFIVQNNTSCKFLSIYLDSCFNWKTHCEFLSSKLASLSYLFYSIKSVLNQNHLLKLYYAQVESLLFLVTSLWLKKGYCVALLESLAHIHVQLFLKSLNFLPYMVCIFMKYACLFLIIDHNFFQILIFIIKILGLKRTYIFLSPE